MSRTTDSLDVLSFLLRERPALVIADDAAAWWHGTASIRARFARPFERALAMGFVADRVGHAFAGGYQAALQALVPSLPLSGIASFCVTEEGGNHPRSIRTRLEAKAGGYVVTGSKKWSTMAPLADVLVVVATEGSDDAGRPKLRAACIGVGTPGLTVTRMPAPPFVPEVPHAELLLDGVKISASAVLPGDGYADYTKAFRTVEDCHVNAGLVGYLLSVAFRSAWPDPVRERLALLAVAIGAVAGLDSRRAETHVALAGFLAAEAALVAEAEPHWSLVSDAERERWYRDRVLVHVASKAREARRGRAWQDLAGQGNP
jgi:acyl-CoA dehydrogenase